MGEFDLIRRYFDRRPTPDLGSGEDTVLLGIGDDAALLKPNGREALAISTDMLVAGRHFPLDTTAEAIGHRSLAVNLSDVAAMGARPVGVTLALALSREHAQPEWLDSFAGGFFTLADQYGVRLVGGDTVAGDQLTLSVTILGYSDPSRTLQRRGAQPGDLIAVTGTLGDAGLGLQIALSPETVPTALSVEDRHWLRQRLDRPTPRVETGLALADFAHAAIDVSDGLVQDLGHVLTASGVGAELDLRAIPLSPAARHFLAAAPEQRLLPLHAGDDYELLFTLPAEAESRLADLPTPVSVIGRITKETGLRVLDADGRPVAVPNGGYDHFRGGEA